MANKAVLCGINHYQSIPDLRGCANDVGNLFALLSRAFEFDAANIRRHVDEQVTREAIEDGFAWMADGARESDQFVFHFSGHGSFTRSEDADELVDELICLHPMDWGDATTYLLDDDLGNLTRLITAGRLTVILDCCYSGTGTRALTRSFKLAERNKRTQLMIVEDTARRLELASRAPVGKVAEELVAGASATMKLLRQPTSPPVFARFATPPARVQRDKVARTRRLGAHVEAALNHQLLAAAADDQTAADARIGSDFHGAFTFYLCDTARQANPGATFQQVIDDTTIRIKARGFRQTPRTEGPYADELFLGGGAIASAPATDDEEPPETFLSVDATQPQPWETAVSSTSETADDPLQLLTRFLRVTEKLTDLARPSVVSQVRTPPSARRADDERVVYVHGISRHRPGYSRPWWSATAPYLDRAIRSDEVLWSHHVNARAAARAAAAAAQECHQLARSIEAELIDRTVRLQRHLEATAGVARSAARLRRPRGAGFAVDDFTRYMLVAETRHAILAEFDRIVTPLLEAGRRVHIVGHSWGSVVAYEALRGLDAERLPGRVANLFAAGSALSIGAVQANLFGRVQDGRRPAHVDRMVNLDAGGDVLGGPIGDAFHVYREYLGLEPVGCRTIPWTSIAWNPVCAHASYFRVANREVNEDIFARFINRF